MEAQQSHLRSPQQPTRMAETFSRNITAAWHAQISVFKTATGNAFVLCYVDDLLFLGEPTAVNKLFTDIQQHLLLRPTGDLSVGNTVNFLGRNIANKGDYYEISLADNYTTELLNEVGMANSNPAPAPEQRSATQSRNRHLTLRNTQRTDEQLANYNG